MGHDEEFSEEQKALQERLTRMRDAMDGYKPVHHGHQSLAKQMLESANSMPYLILLGSPGPGIGKSAFTEDFLKVTDFGCRRERPHVFKYEPGRHYVDESRFTYLDWGIDGLDDFHVIDDEKKMPEWQRRQKRSAEAKAALVAKLKAKR